MECIILNSGIESKPRKVTFLIQWYSKSKNEDIDYEFLLPDALCKDVITDI